MTVSLAMVFKSKQCIKCNDQKVSVSLYNEDIKVHLSFTQKIVRTECNPPQSKNKKQNKAKNKQTNKTKQNKTKQKEKTKNKKLQLF